MIEDELWLLVRPNQIGIHSNHFTECDLLCSVAAVCCCGLLDMGGF